MKASIIVVTYNSAWSIRRCLESIQYYSVVPYEIIVVDNASDDGTLQLIKQEFPQVRLIENSRNEGFASANDQAARLAEGEVLCFVNPDVYVTHGWLEPMLACLEANPDAATASPLILHASDPTRLNALGNQVYLSGLTYSPDLDPASLGQGVKRLTVFSGACFIISRELFLRVGGFTPEFFMYFEDTDLALRLRQAGMRHLAVLSSRVLHDYQPGFTPAKIFYLERNRLLSWLSLVPFWAFLLSLPAWLLSELMIWTFCLVRGREYLPAKANAWREVFQRWAWIKSRRQSARGADLSWLKDLSPFINLQYLQKGLISSAAEVLLFLAALPSVLLIRLVLFFIPGV